MTVAWHHVAAFGLVFMLDAKRSIVPIFIYSGSLILQIFLGLDNSTNDAWDVPRFFQYISIHGFTLCFAYFKWSVDNAYQEPDEARELERKNARNTPGMWKNYWKIKNNYTLWIRE